MGVLLAYNLCTICMHAAHRDQKMALGALQMKLPLVVSYLICYCWDLNPDSLKEQSMIAVPSL